MLLDVLDVLGALVAGVEGLEPVVLGALVDDASFPLAAEPAFDDFASRESVR